MYSRFLLNCAVTNDYFNLGRPQCLFSDYSSSRTAKTNENNLNTGEAARVLVCLGLSVLWMKDDSVFLREQATYHL